MGGILLSSSEHYKKPEDEESIIFPSDEKSRITLHFTHKKSLRSDAEAFEIGCVLQPVLPGFHIVGIAFDFVRTRAINDHRTSVERGGW